MGNELVGVVDDTGCLMRYRLLAEISTYCALAAGDLVFTGTPAGVGKLASGDLVTGGVEGVGEIGIEIR